MVTVPDLLSNVLEQIAFEARDSEYIDEKSGVSARLSISAYENLVSAAERRALINKEKKTVARFTDFWGAVPAITGKVELVYEGEQEGPYQVAMNLMGGAIKKFFLAHFPHPEKLKKGQDRDPYGTLRAWFAGGNAVELLNDGSDKAYQKALDGVVGLRKFTKEYIDQVKDKGLYPYMELVLHWFSGVQCCE